MPSKSTILNAKHRARHLLRVRAQKRLAYAKRKGYAPCLIARRERDVAALPLNVCPKCGEDYRGHKRTGECFT